MNGFLSLKILDKFGGIFTKIGIDYEVMRAILEAKLTLDSRRVSITDGGRKSKSENISFIKRYLLHLIFGVFLAAFIYFIKDEMIRMIYFAGAFFFMTTMYLISDFSFVLLDTRDKNILMTKPIDGKVVSMSKVLHILIYMISLNTFIAGPSMAVIVYQNGMVAAPVFILEILLMDLLIFLITAFIYILVLRFFDGELLRNIINFIQIALTILVSIGYQIAVRMIDFTELQNISYKFESHNYFNPILWFGAPFEMLFNNGREPYLYVFTALMIIVPVISFAIYLKLSRKMESLLLKLDGEERGRSQNRRYERFLGNILSKNETVRQAFHFSNGILRSDRNLKLKIYPALATGVMVPVIMIFNSSTRGSQLETTGYEYLFLYFNLIIIPNILNLMLYSSAWKGAYVYGSSGFGDFKSLYRGIMLSAATFLIIPVMLLSCAIYLILFKGRFIMDMTVFMLANIAVLPVMGRLSLKSLPFSMALDDSNQNKNFDAFFASLGIVACTAAIHGVSHIVPMGIYICAALMIISIPLSWRFVVPEKIKGI